MGNKNIIGTYQYRKSDNFMYSRDRFNPGKNISNTLTTKYGEAIVYNNLEIRKLTPKECWRLMGFTDKDFEKARNAGLSDSQLYKQAGNSIVVNVLEAIFKQML